VLLAQDAAPRRGFSITITDPPNQSIVLGRTRITADVKVDDPRRIDRVEFLVDDEVVFVDREPPWECSYDFGEETGSRIIQAVAYHREAVKVSDTVITRRMGFTAVRVNRVLLWVSATDKSDELIGDLTRDDFRVYENDVPQEVLEFFKEERPITMAFLLDSSGSMQTKLKEVHDAASAFVGTLRPDDQALVIDFDDKVFLTQELTSDHAALKEAITSTEAMGGTAVYDALHAAYRKLGKLQGRKVIILLSDGADTFSEFGYKRVLEEARGNDTMIFSIVIGGEGGADKDAPRAFSEATGGRFFYVRQAAELAGVYEKIAEELRTQYFLAYSTSNEVWDGRWMKIRVESTRPGVTVRSRSGYFAVRRTSD
jgi:Ca-activated chloride channel family protein